MYVDANGVVRVRRGGRPEGFSPGLSAPAKVELSSAPPTRIAVVPTFYAGSAKALSLYAGMSKAAAHAVVGKKFRVVKPDDGEYLAEWYAASPYTTVPAGKALLRALPVRLEVAEVDAGTMPRLHENEAWRALSVGLEVTV